MSKKNNHRIYVPLYLYFTALALYFSSRGLGDFAATKWNDYIFSFLVYIAPFLSLLITIYLYRQQATKRKEINVFLLGAIPGFFPGAIFGYGIWGMSHSDTIISFLFNTVATGLPTAVVFGVLGSLYDYILEHICKQK